MDLFFYSKKPDKIDRAFTIVLSGGAVYANPPTKGPHDILSGTVDTDLQHPPMNVHTIA